MVRSVAFWGLLATVVIAIAGYAWLGGFQSEKIREVKYGARTVVGKVYQGAYGDLELRKIFVEAQKQIDKSGNGEAVIVVNYDSLTDTQEVNQLIGTLSSPTVSIDSSNQTIDTLPASTYVRVQVYGHPVVRPTPSQVNEKVRTYAANQQFVLEEEVIEHYFGADSMWIEYPIRKN